MRPFGELYARAARRKGGEAALEALIPRPKSAAELAAIGDDRWLSQMAKSVFQAGFVWRVVEHKWPAFERAFQAFDPHAVAYLSDDELDGMLADASLIRHHAKLRAVRDNARFLLDLAAEHGSAARYFAASPRGAYVDLLLTLKRRGSRLGGHAAQYCLRRMGVDSFILTRDVVAVLVDEGVVAREPTSQRDLRAVQAAFDDWCEQSGRGLTSVSRVLALSID
ncbi:MAG: DNA-3-methyladenine glycosylase I [Gammaproteobacteria bacterium]|nr:DNA-3-methyladenine glycosylase I [Gammaproteobacteria bacterium]